jgi:putative methyltransferase (TIGR04325 family)
MSPTNEFTVLDTWEEASRHSAGYEDSQLVSNLVAQLKIKKPWIQEPGLDKNIDERSMQLLFALQLATMNVGALVRVADIGGGNGYMGYIARRWLSHLQWDWTVFESASIAASYSVFESEAGIKWFSNPKDDFIETYDVAILSCTLQYVEDPYDLLRKAAASSRYLLIMRLPFVAFGETDVCTVQRPLEGVYAESQASWPCWFFSRSNFESFIESQGQVLCRWVTTSETVTLRNVTIPLEGLLVRTGIDEMRH